MITQHDMIEILNELDIDRLNQHLEDGSLSMMDLEGQIITKVSRLEESDELFHLWMDEKCVNTINDSYLYNCGFGSPHWS